MGGPNVLTHTYLVDVLHGSHLVDLVEVRGVEGVGQVAEGLPLEPVVRHAGEGVHDPFLSEDKIN